MEYGGTLNGEQMENTIETRIEKLENRVVDLEQLIKGSNKKIGAKKSVSIKEFMLSKSPKDDVQRTLLIGYYLEKYRNFENFVSKDLEEGFSNSKESIPENMSDKIAKNIRKGHLMELPKGKGRKRSLTVTNSGETFVESGFK